MCFNILKDKAKNLKKKLENVKEISEKTNDEEFLDEIVNNLFDLIKNQINKSFERLDTLANDFELLIDNSNQMQEFNNICRKLDNFYRNLFAFFSDHKLNLKFNPKLSNIK